MGKPREDIGETKGDQNNEAPMSQAGIAGADDKDRLIEELRAAVSARDNLLATVAHELRNPLTPIQLCVRLIRNAQERGDSGRIEAELARLERSLDRFLNRTTTLLSLAQLSADRLVLNPVAIDLSETIREVVDGLTPVAAHSGSTLRVTIPDGIAGVSDPVAIAQVLENLLSNAIKYGAGKPIELAMRADSGRVNISVRDEGLGIAEQDCTRIFEPFERAAGRREQPGFGLGLWITRKLVEAMGGTITVTSKEGAGSLFTVELPLNGIRHEY